MKLSVDRRTWILFLPTLIILSQFIRIGPINASWILYGLIIIGIVFRHKKYFYDPRMVLFTICVVLFPFISSVWSVSSSFNFNLYFSLLTGVAVMLYIENLDSIKFDYFMVGVIIACFFFSALGFFEMITGRYLFVNELRFMIRLNLIGSHYPIVAFANPNDLGQFLSMLLPVSSVYCFYKKKMKLFAIASNILGAYIIFNTESNMSMITFVLTYILFIFLNNKGKIIVSQKILVSIVAVAGIFVINYKTGLITRMVNDVFFVSTNDIHFTTRAALYQNLFNGIMAHPFGGFGNAYAITEPHNLLLYILSDFGIILTAIFLFAYIRIIIRFYKFNKESGNNLSAIILSSSILLFFSASISSGNEQRKAVWIVLGIYLWHLVNLTNQNREEEG